MRVVQTWMNGGEHVLSIYFVSCASLQSSHKNVDLRLVWVQIQVLPLPNSGTLEIINVLIYKMGLRAVPILYSCFML